MSQLGLINSILLWVATTINLILILAIIRKLNTMGGPPPITPLQPGDTLPDLDTQNLSSSVPDASLKLSDFLGREFLLIFISPNCESCRQVLSSLQDPKPSRDAIIPIAIFSIGSLDETRTMIYEYKITLPVATIPRDISERIYKVAGTPFFYLINTTGVVIGGGVIRGPEWTALARQRDDLPHFEEPS